MEIVLAEDNPGDVRLIQEALKEHNIICNLQVFSDGESAIGFMGTFADPGSRCPDLIMLDLNLPKRDGREVLKLIKRTPRIQGVPILVVSSSDSPLDQAETVELGADRYVRKPTTLDDFLEIGALAKELLPSK